MKKTYSTPLCEVMQLTSSSILTGSITERAGSSISGDFVGEAKNDVWQFDDEDGFDEASSLK